MSFLTTLKSLSDYRPSKVRLSIEVPTQSFSRMCYGYLQNDWIMVFSSGTALIITCVAVVFAGIHQVTKGA